MLEAEKMLHLRKYVLTILRSDVRSRMTCALHSASPSSTREGGYVLRSLYHCYVSPTSLRPSYVACGIKTFSTDTAAQSPVDHDVDQKLTSFCDDVTLGQTWSADRLKEVIRLCNENNYQLQSDTGLLLLKCCGNSLSTVKLNERQDFVDQVWRLTKRNSGALTLEHYNTLLNVHAQNSSSVDPNEFLADMSVKPDDDTYRLLFNTAVKTGNTKHLQSIMSIIKDKNILLSEDAFCTLMQSYLTKGNITEAVNVIAYAQNAKLPVDKLYNKLAHEYATQGDIPNLVKILNDEPQNGTSLVEIIKSLSVSGNGRHISTIMTFLMPSFLTIKSEINKLIMDLVRVDRVADAYMIINCIGLNDKTAEHVKSFIDNFLTQLITMNAPVNDVTEFASNFVKSGHDPMALTNIAEMSLKLGREKQTFSIFGAMRQMGIEIRPHYYWPLLINAQRNEGEVKIYSILTSMRNANVEFDHETLASYVLPYVNTSYPIATVQRLKMCGIPVSFINTPVIYFLLNEQRLQDALHLYEQSKIVLNYKVLIRPLIKTYFATEDIESCLKILTTFKEGYGHTGTFLLKILRSNHPVFNLRNLEHLLLTFEKHNVTFSLNDSAYLKKFIREIAISQISEPACNIIDRMTDEHLQIPCLLSIPHPQYMNTSQLACHLVELKSQGFGTRKILQRLLEKYCTEDNLQKVEEIKEEYDKSMYKWTPGMKITLFNMYVKHGKLKEAESLLLEVRDTFEEFYVDSNKILLFAIALVKADKPEMAVDIIDNISKTNNKKNMNMNCSKLLHTLAESKYYENTESMLYLLLQKQYCGVTTELLRPLVAIPLKQNNIPQAIEKMKKCAYKYNKVPMALDILTVLLREKNSLPNASQYIEEVYDIIVRARGIEKANTIVVIALANCNKMKELRSVLQVTETCSLYFFDLLSIDYFMN